MKNAAGVENPRTRNSTKKPPNNGVIAFTQAVVLAFSLPIFFILLRFSALPESKTGLKTKLVTVLAKINGTLTPPGKEYLILAIAIGIGMAMAILINSGPAILPGPKRGKNKHLAALAAQQRFIIFTQLALLTVLAAITATIAISHVVKTDTTLTAYEAATEHTTRTIFFVALLVTMLLILEMTRCLLLLGDWSKLDAQAAANPKRAIAAYENRPAWSGIVPEVLTIAAVGAMIAILVTSRGATSLVLDKTLIVLLHVIPGFIGAAFLGTYAAEKRGNPRWVLQLLGLMMIVVPAAHLRVVVTVAHFGIHGGIEKKLFLAALLWIVIAASTRLYGYSGIGPMKWLLGYRILHLADSSRAGSRRKLLLASLGQVCLLAISPLLFVAKDLSPISHRIDTLLEALLLLAVLPLTLLILVLWPLFAPRGPLRQLRMIVVALLVVAYPVASIFAYGTVAQDLIWLGILSGIATLAWLAVAFFNWFDPTALDPTAPDSTGVLNTWVCAPRLLVEGQLSHAEDSLRSTLHLEEDESPATR